MSLIVYGNPASRAFGVPWTAEELGIPYETRNYDVGGPEIRSPAFLAINPNGLIPAIEDDGMPWFESLAIERWPNLGAWHRRCYERPAARRAVAMREGMRA